MVDEKGFDEMVVVFFLICVEDVVVTCLIGVHVVAGSVVDELLTPDIFVVGFVVEITL